jgi:WD40 repeat protein
VSAIVKQLLRLGGAENAGSDFNLLAEVAAPESSPRVGHPSLPSKHLVAVLGDGRGSDWSAIVNLAFHPNGEEIASAGGSLLLWDPVTMLPKQELGDPADITWCVAYAQKGKTLISGTQEGRLRLWTRDQGWKAALDVKAHEGHLCLAVSPDGETVASGGMDGKLLLWNLRDKPPKSRKVLENEKLVGIHSLAFSPDGRFLACGWGRGAIIIVDLVDNTQTLLPCKEGCQVSSLVFSLDEKFLISADWGDAIRIWNTATWKEEYRFPKTITAETLALSPDGKILASGGVFEKIVSTDANGKNLAKSISMRISLIDLSTRKVLATREAHQLLISSLCFSPNGKTLASGSEDNTIETWDVSHGDIRRTIESNGHRGPVEAIAFFPNSYRFVSSGLDRTLRVWNWKSGAVKAEAITKTERTIESLVFFPDGKRLASGGRLDIMFRLWDMSLTPPKEKLAWRDIEEEERSPPDCIALSADGSRLACGRQRGTVSIWTLSSGLPTLFGRIVAGFSGTERVSFSPDGKTLACKGLDALQLWDVSTNQPKKLKELNLKDKVEGNGSVDSLAWGPKSDYIAFGCASIAFDRAYNQTYLWNVKTGKFQIVRKGLRLGSPVFSSDGKMLIYSGQISKESCLIFWDLHSGRELGHWKLPNLPSNLSISYDNRYLAAGNANGTIFIFDISSFFSRLP